MSKQSILIVEDEAPIAEVLEVYCKNSGYATHIISEGGSVVDFVKAAKPSLILLDLMLPDRDGLDIFKEIRTFSDVPVIIVTAKIEEIDRLIGLELGADDYICKPFIPREVVARVKSVLRRTYGDKPSQEKYVSSSDTHRGYVDNKDLNLTPKEFKLFDLFCRCAGRVFSRDQIIDSVYSAYDDITDRNIDTHIKNIRKKISHIDVEASPIVSVYGVGYKFEPGA